MLNRVNPRIAELVQKKAGDKLDIVLLQAEELVAQGKTMERALADALEKFKLV